MSFPNISEYNKSILEHNGFAFRTLRGLNFVPSRSQPIKIYTFGSGSFAVTFRASDGNKDFAIRCFNVPNYEIINRYSSIVSHLNQINESWKVDIEYYNDEILVGNSYFPIIKMDWVSGLQLNEFIGRHLSNNNILTTIQEKLVELSESLERSQVGHGDLQSSNLIVWESKEDITLKLIDYDGMYVPAFRGRTILKSIFLHPNFDKIEFNERIDRFSIWLLLTALEALKYDKALWNSPLENGFNNGDNILFEPGMLADFASSGLYKRLKDLNISSLNLYLNKLKSYSNLSFDPNNVDKPEIFKSDDIVEPSPTKPISPISLPVLIIPTPLSTPRSITINSNPEGLPVFIDNNVHAQIGVTPLNYSYDQLKNRTVYIKQGKESKQFTFNENPNDINLVFENEDSGNFNSPLVISSFFLFFFLIGLIVFNLNKERNVTDILESAEGQIDGTEVPEIDTFSHLITKKDSFNITTKFYSEFYIYFEDKWKVGDRLPKDSLKKAFGSFDPEEKLIIIEGVKYLFYLYYTGGAHCCEGIACFKYDSISHFFNYIDNFETSGVGINFETYPFRNFENKCYFYSSYVFCGSYNPICLEEYDQSYFIFKDKFKVNYNGNYNQLVSCFKTFCDTVEINFDYDTNFSFLYDHGQSVTVLNFMSSIFLRNRDINKTFLLYFDSYPSIEEKEKLWFDIVENILNEKQLKSYNKDFYYKHKLQLNESLESVDTSTY